MKIARRILLIILFVIAIIYVSFWVFSLKKYPVDFGISFNREHATYLGLDWKEVYIKMLKELKPKYIRIDAAWDYVEKERGIFNLTDIDWQMDEAKKHNTKVVLVIGQKTPRWPECRVPNWAEGLSVEEYNKSVKEYINFVVNRYYEHPALEIWQVENEPFINFAFGECKRFDKEVVREEISLVKSLDKEHKVLVTDSGELSTWREAAPAGDIFGTTVYRVVMTPQGWYWNYDWLPAGFYRFKAYVLGIKKDNFFVSELQAEPWYSDPDKISLSEQKKSMDLDRLNKNIEFTQKMNVSRAYLWGVEWWYFMKEKQDDSVYWDFIKELNNK